MNPENTIETLKDDRLSTAINAVLGLLNDGKQEWHYIRTNLETIRANHETLTRRVLMIEDWSRKPFPQKIIRTYLDVLAEFFNRACPCCGKTPILDDKGKRTTSLEIDHFRGPKWNKLHDGWPICRQCHYKLTHGYLNREGWVSQAFAAYQMRVNQYVESQVDRKQMRWPDS